MNHSTTAWCLVLLLIGAPSAGVSQSEMSWSPDAADHEIFVLSPGYKLPNAATILGEISVTDAGLSVDCSLTKVIDSVKIRAVVMGADAIQITDIEAPGLRQCYAVTALAIAIDEDLISDLTGPFHADKLSVIDSSLCLDGGATSDLPTMIRGVYVIPFTVHSVVDDSVFEAVEYPKTIARIRKYIDSSLGASGHTVVNPGDKNYPLDELLKYHASLVRRAMRAAGPPSEWDQAIRSAIVDSSSLIYIPLAIEWESKGSITARCYFLLADSTGRILYSRCLPYDAFEWSSNVNSFKRDVAGRMPLVK